MKVAKKGILILMLATGGCSQRLDQCANFSSNYPRIKLSPASVSEVSLDSPVIKKARLSILDCYPRNAYMGLHNKIEIREALRANADNYFIISQLDGVSELILVFKVDNQGEVIGSYQSSMAWRGNPGE